MSRGDLCPTTNSWDRGHTDVANAPMAAAFLRGLGKGVFPGPTRPVEVSRDVRHLQPSKPMLKALLAVIGEAEEIPRT